jgi:hypothetical protein
MRSTFPVARISKLGGISVPPPQRSLAERIAVGYDELGDGVKGFVSAVVGLWPITVILAMSLGLCWAATMSGQ